MVSVYFLYSSSDSLSMAAMVLLDEMGVLLYHLSRSFGAGGYQTHNFFVDFCAHLFGVRTEVLGILKTDVAYSVVHAKLSNYAMGYLVSLLQVIRCSVGAGTEKVLLSASPSQYETNSVYQLTLCV